MEITNTIKTDWREINGKVQMVALQEVTEDKKTFYIVNGDVHYRYDSLKTAEAAFNYTGKVI